MIVAVTHSISRALSNSFKNMESILHWLRHMELRLFICKKKSEGKLGHVISASTTENFSQPDFEARAHRESRSHVYGVFNLHSSLTLASPILTSMKLSTNHSNHWWQTSMRPKMHCSLYIGQIHQESQLWMVSIEVHLAHSVVCEKAPFISRALEFSFSINKDRWTNKHRYLSEVFLLDA